MRRRGRGRGRLGRDLGDGDDIAQVEPEQASPLADDRPWDAATVPRQCAQRGDAVPGPALGHARRTEKLDLATARHVEGRAEKLAEGGAPDLSTVAR